MDLDVLTPDGRSKKVRRHFFVRCWCGAHLDCPEGEVPWAWLKEDSVQSFWAEHATAHGRVAAQIETIVEGDDEDDGEQQAA